MKKIDSSDFKSMVDGLPGYLREAVDCVDGAEINFKG